MRTALIRRFLFPGLVAAALLAGTGSARALFHLAVIDEIMTSYAGDNTAQFVEIRMNAGAQTITTNSVLAAFDASGNYIADVFVVPGNLANGGAGLRWIMGTASFQTASGIAADFLIPASLPVSGGMVCWGAPGIIPPAPGAWDHTLPTNYVDCVAYGSYSGPTNPLIGNATGLTPVGHSLARVSSTNDNATDFSCADPATPTNNSATSASLSATASCTPSVPISPAFGLILLTIAIGFGGALMLVLAHHRRESA